MVVKMAAEGIRSPSPPLPPDPSTLPSKINTFQGPSVDLQQETIPVSPTRERSRRNLERIDSSQTGPQPAQLPPVLPQRQPIQDAVHNVFENQTATPQLGPEFINELTKQVTEQVIKNLQAAGAAAAAATPTPSIQPQQTAYAPPPPPPPPPQSHAPQSPTQSSVGSNHERFTPPTPERQREARYDREDVVSSPEPPLSDSSNDYGNFGRQSFESIKSNESQNSRDTPRPFARESSSRMRRSSYASRRRSSPVPFEDLAASRDFSGSEAGRDNPPLRRNSRGSEASYDGASRSRIRPTRVPSAVEETPLEKFWQPLFDNGNPTIRLSQFLRGLALHIIDDYEPKGSIVVTPAKMLQFLNETKVEHELYPWDIIFGGKLTTVSISSMFQKLLCQHHLIQDRYDRTPTVPGLTPLGFDWFMTCLIQAHPDTEFERLAKAVMNMPISNADNKSERFPKELSRRLLPAEPNVQAAQRLVSSLNHEPYIIAQLKGTIAMPPPPPPPASAPPNSFGIERERKPYSSTLQQSNAVDDDDLNAVPQMPIERERQPYTAKERSGKIYDDGRPSVSQLRSDAGGGRPSRTNSGVPPQAMNVGNSAPSEPMNIPMRSHRMSTSQVPPPATNGGYSKSARRLSPPLKSTNTRSQPEYVGSMPNSEFGSNLHPTYSREQYPVDFDTDQFGRVQSRPRGERSNTTSNNPNDEDTNGRGYSIPGRNVPIANGYDYGGGSVGGPPIGQSGGPIPVGSYPSRRPMQSVGPDDRRRSTFVSPTNGMGGNDGGTDGYGSFSNAYQPQQSYGSSVQH